MYVLIQYSDTRFKLVRWLVQVVGVSMTHTVSHSVSVVLNSQSIVKETLTSDEYILVFPISILKIYIYEI